MILSNKKQYTLMEGRDFVGINNLIDFLNKKYEGNLKRRRRKLKKKSWKLTYQDIWQPANRGKLPTYVGHWSVYRITNEVIGITFYRLVAKELDPNRTDVKI